MNQLPYIFILDWDGTCVGNVEFQSQQYSLFANLKKNGFKPIKTHSIPPAFYPKSKLVRPGLANFIKSMEEFYPQVYFFIFTASEKNWANTEIPWVEKTNDIKFARPIFTRDDCTNDSAGINKKSINKIFPKILRAISKNEKYSNTDKHLILENNTIVIDNNAVYLDRTDKLLLCPDYHYTVFENLLHGIPIQARKNDRIKQLLQGYINQGYMCCPPDKNMDVMVSLTEQYKWLSAKCKSIIEDNNNYLNDEFWKILKKLIIQNQVKVYSASIIKQLQEAVWSHYKKK